EYLATIQDEVSRVWKRKHTLVTYIFFSNRCLTLLYSGLSLAALSADTTDVCSLPSFLARDNSDSYQVFSAFRVYALWNRDWKLPLLVFTLNIIPVGTDIVLGLCNRFCVITADVLVLGSTWFKTLATQRESRRLGLNLRISHLLFRDGEP
ncbi:hypothetical protein BDY19DRAFT_892611, partial [Irpex rosettiformis]